MVTARIQPTSRRLADKGTWNITWKALRTVARSFWQGKPTDRMCLGWLRAHLYKTHTLFQYLVRLNHRSSWDLKINVWSGGEEGGWKYLLKSCKMYICTAQYIYFAPMKLMTYSSLIYKLLSNGTVLCGACSNMNNSNKIIKQKKKEQFKNSLSSSVVL